MGASDKKAPSHITKYLRVARSMCLVVLVTLCVRVELHRRIRGKHRRLKSEIVRMV